MLEELHNQYGHIIRPLLVGTLVASVCSTVGCFIVLRRMSFLADAIAHSMLAGVVGGYLIVKIFYGEEAQLGAMLIGAILAGMITVGLVGLVTRFSRLKEDTAIGIMYTGIFALGAFALSLRSVSQHVQIDIYHYLVGSVLAVSDAEIWLLAIVSSIVFSSVLLFYRSLQITAFDPVMAASLGVPVLMIDYLLTMCTSLVVVSGVQIVGVILVVALVITPAATAYLLSRRLSEMLRLSLLIGVGGFWGGFLMAMLWGGSPGAAIVLVMTGVFAIAMLFAPHHGLWAHWMQQRTAVSQEILEDVMGALSRSDQKVLSKEAIARMLALPFGQIQRAIGVLERKGFLNQLEQGVVLTEPGQQEATRILRAHRLWEKFLQKTGTPADQLHSRAHQLEHITDKSTMDYLDDQLGHPWYDPQGKMIPAESLPENGVGALSLLREGARAEVLVLDKKARSVGLQVGNRIVIGPRSEDGESWTVRLPDGSCLQLDHDQADAVSIRFLGD
jgi:ABC-type Mn2+/Zn2+ transport system permease subunit/Mn-dependent DtxR family transcriptional regulator